MQTLLGHSSKAWLLYLWLLAAVSVVAHAQIQPQQPAPQTTIRIASEEVLLDVVARDKKGRPVTDLKAEDLEVYEDGVKQKLTTFRRIDRNALTTAVATTPAAPNAPSPVIDPLRQINLVTMIFERLNNESRTFARDAAYEFIKSELRDNTMVAVFVLDQRISALQQFTNDATKLKAAIDRAVGSASSQFAEQSEALRRELENQEKAQSAVESLSANAQSNGGSGIGQAAVQAKLAEIMVNTLRMTDDAQRQQQGASSIYSLLALVREQRRLAGRKTVLYFSEGLKLTPALKDVFQSVISAANRANVSFYAIDARGLQTARQTDEQREALSAAVKAGEQQMRSRGGQPVTAEQAKAFDTAEGSIYKNSQDNLASLAESTGGLLIANTNDLRAPMHRIAAELGNYYELSYTPTASDYNGKFREIKVKLARPDVVLQTRNGYFALPPNESGGPVALGYELPMLEALNTPKLPREFETHATLLHFDASGEGTHHTLLFEVPLANLTLVADQEKKIYKTHFALLAVLKNAQGEVVQKFAQDYPLDGPLDRLEALKRGNVVFVRNFRLAPGRYTLETVAHDREANRLSARRAIVMVAPARAGLAMSSVSVIKRIDPIDRTVKDPDNPLRFADGKIIPNLGEPIALSASGKLSFYFAVYPAIASSEKPKATLEFLLDGEVIARAPAELPQADEQGRIPYIATVPLETFKSGRYELRAVVQQGGQAVEEHAFFTIAEASK